MAAAGEIKMKSIMPDWWRWVVLMATLYMNCVVNGYTYCFGLVKLPLMEEYPEVSAMMLALVGGAVPSIYMFFAPVSIALSEYFGIRYTTMFASFFSAFCFFCAWANSVFLHWGFMFDLFCLGVGQGVAFTLLYGPSVAYLPQYFRLDQLAFAAGVANAGSSIGIIIYGLISNPLFGIFGMRGAMLIYACISLQGLIAGMAFMPMIPVRVKPEPAAIEMTEQNKDAEAQESLIKQAPVETSKPEKIEMPKKQFLPVIKRYFDLNLFRQWTFICIMGAAGFSIVGYFVPTLLLPGHARDPQHNVHPAVASNIMAIFGILNLTGRFVLGKVGDMGMRYAICSPFWLYVASLVIGALCFVILPHVMIFGDVPFIAFAVIFGFTCAPLITMRSLLTTTLFGKKNANASYGWFLCAQGGLQMIGYLVPAWLEQNLGKIFAYSFSVIMFLIAALCCLVTLKPYFRERQKQIDELAGKNTAK